MTEESQGIPGRPELAPEDATSHLAAHWGLRGEVAELPSDRDRNFRVRCDDRTVIVKFANSRTDDAELRRQMDALGRARRALSDLQVHVPEVLPSLDGEALVAWTSASGACHASWVVGWIDGVPLAECEDRPDGLFGDLGQALAECDLAFAGMEWPEGSGSPFDWDLLEAPRVLGRVLEAPGAGGLDNEGRRALLQETLTRFEQRVVPRLAELPRCVLHGDANDWNVLVRLEGHEPRLHGLIDFGDQHRSARICEVAIAAAYGMLDASDPVHVLAAVCRGYHETCELSEAELEVVWDLARTRLAISVAMAARQRALEPDNEYLSVTEEPAWRTLEATESIPSGLAVARIRAHCRLEPCAAAPAVRQWLEDNARKFAPVIPGLTASTDVLDLSVASLDVPAGDEPSDVLALQRRLARYADAEGHARAYGRYAEARLLYATSPAFRTEAGEYRTVHLGVDVFAPVRTEVAAPLAGVVESVAINEEPLDYGPTVILRHEPAGGPRFWTLHGHLAAESIENLEVGQSIEAGEVFAALGAAEENGGWPPHLHLQVMADLLGSAGSGDFPGVAAPSEAAAWLSICPDPSALVSRRVGVANQESLHRRRKQLLGPSLSLSYRKPLHIVRGSGAYLFDSSGRRYLDLVNNVCHVGHCHPRVVAALAAQAGTLNTNTRYLHDNVLRYAEKLLAKFPAPLDTVLFVNSGSEANDLAMRMMRAHTGGERWICVDAAYHGHTAQLIDVSPYKHAARGGAGRPGHVHALDLPDVYRGRHRGAEAGAAYARDLREEVTAAAASGPLAGFLCESILSCGGQIELPSGYLEAAYEAVRSQGGCCLADEVQVGFGRVGDAFWGFELQGVVPDVVTLGKPIGNGHPLAAVVTTRAIADSFDNGMEYFNTYGGNPVSAAVGEAVLDVIEEEGLQERARVLGGRLRDGLLELQSRHESIGDVRGRGLFLGLEFVTDRDGRAPDAARASLVVDRMMRRGFLLSTDGPQHDVIKIKPPLAITAEDVDATLDALDDVLRATGA